MAALAAPIHAGELVPPFDRHVAEKVVQISAPQEHLRARAAEALGFMRAYAASDSLEEALGDTSIRVRREAALALAPVKNPRNPEEIVANQRVADAASLATPAVLCSHTTAMGWCVNWTFFFSFSFSNR